MVNTGLDWEATPAKNSSGGDAPFKQVPDGGSRSDGVLITAVVVAGILFIVVLAILSVMITSHWKKKKPSKYSSKFGSMKRHPLATPAGKDYLLDKYKRVPYPPGMKIDGLVPARYMNPIYNVELPEEIYRNGPFDFDSSLPETESASGNPADAGLASTITGVSLTSQLLTDLKIFQTMNTGSPLFQRTEL